MTYTISGVIREHESRLPVRGLMVRAYDKELLHEDDLAVAFTDGNGRFEMHYAEKDFRDLFKKKPDIHLAVYAQPLRLLIKTKESVCWGATEHEHIELEISRELLREQSPSRPEDRVEVGVQFSLDKLVIAKRGDYDVPRLQGFTGGGVFGAPTLLEQVHYIALPPGAKVLGLEIVPGDAIRLPGPVNPYPVQRLVPRTEIARDGARDIVSHERPPIRFTPLDPRLFEGGTPYPKELVVLGQVAVHLGIQVAEVRVRPMQYDPATRVFICYPHLRYVCKYERPRAQQAEGSHFMSWKGYNKIHAGQLQAFLSQENVYAAKDAFPSFVFPTPFRQVPYVIITDEYEWPVTDQTGTRPPTLNERGVPLDKDACGQGPVAHFERLAEWKTSRGMRTQVVTISDIIDAKKWGDFSKDARDLQEVIHNFITHIYRDWGTLFLLMGGSDKVVPMRHLIGYATNDWDFIRNRSSDWDTAYGPDPPPPRGCYVDANQARLRHDGGLGAKELFQAASRAVVREQLCTTLGQVIPFKHNPGDGTLGWYFADKDFQPLPGNDPSWYAVDDPKSILGKNPPSVCNLIVEGPNETINADYYWAFFGERFIPSDLYYATIQQETGKHHFDLNNNELYGQYYLDKSTWIPGYAMTEVSKDVASLWPTISVGRAPVESGSDAKAFVEKVLTYERLEAPDRLGIDQALLKLGLATNAGLDTVLQNLVLTTGDSFSKALQKLGLEQWAIDLVLAHAGSVRDDAGKLGNVRDESTGNLREMLVDDVLFKLGLSPAASVGLILQALDLVGMEAVDPDYLRRVVLGAQPWSEDYIFSQVPTDQSAPRQGEFTYGKNPQGEVLIMIHLQDNLLSKLTSADPTWAVPNVLARFHSDSIFTSTDVQVPNGQVPPSYPYPGGLKWSYLTPGGEPTDFVMIEGEALQNKPVMIVWFPTRALTDRQRPVEDAAEEKETVRKIIATGFPNFTEVQRYYIDAFGLDGVSPPVEPLKHQRIRAAIDNGCHFVSLTGHGGAEGSCMVWCPLAYPGWDGGSHLENPDFKNYKRYCILYANSCWTGIPDILAVYDHATQQIVKYVHIHPHSLGEHMVLYPNGGAVAYVGYVRMSGEEGRYHEESFWTNLTYYGRLGPAAGSKYPINPEDHIYGTYIQILYGDPEMPIWTDIPRTYEVIHPEEVAVNETVTIVVLYHDLPLKDQQVTFFAGWTDSETEPVILKTVLTDENGIARFIVPADPPADLKVTITPPLDIVPGAVVTAQGRELPRRRDFKPFVVRIPIKKVLLWK